MAELGLDVVGNKVSIEEVASYPLDRIVDTAGKGVEVGRESVGGRVFEEEMKVVRGALELNGVAGVRTGGGVAGVEVAGSLSGG